MQISPSEPKNQPTAQPHVSYTTTVANAAGRAFSYLSGMAQAALQTAATTKAAATGCFAAKPKIKEKQA